MRWAAAATTGVMLCRVTAELRYLGSLAAALTRDTASLAIAERLAKAAPTNAEWQRDPSISRSKVDNVRRATKAPIQLEVAECWTSSLTESKKRRVLAQAAPACPRPLDPDEPELNPAAMARRLADGSRVHAVAAGEGAAAALASAVLKLSYSAAICSAWSMTFTSRRACTGSSVVALK